MNDMAAKERKKVIEKDIKCVVWDLDHTLWDGVLSEGDEVSLKPGIKGILAELDERGILLSICSRNNYEDAMGCLKKWGIEHYFLYPQINWGAKSASISKIQELLNIGIDSFLMIDDQLFELDEVKSVHKDINIIDASFYKEMITEPKLMPRFITEDSKRRRLLYVEDMQRKDEEVSFKGAQEEFLKALEMQFIISEATEGCLQRAEELTVRTNQLNSTGCTYNYNELNYFREVDNYQLLVCELTDKYGSYGKIGLALIHITKTHFYIKLLLMSCRVIARGVGTILLSHIMNEAKLQKKGLIADFKKTNRNKMMEITYRFAGFKEKETTDEGVIILENDLSSIQKFPPFINVVIP